MRPGIQWNETLRGPDGAPLVVFLHGFMGSVDDWAQTVAAFEDRYRCLCLDLPGHGRTVVDGGVATWTMPVTAQALLERIAALGPVPCVLVGYSLGGRLALYTAVHYPAHFRGVVLESASPGMRSDEERQVRREQDDLLADRLERIGANPSQGAFQAFLRAWYEVPMFATLKDHRDTFEAMMARRLRNRPESLAASLRGLGTGAQPGLWAQLPSYSVPTLAVVGEKDRKFRQIAEAMSDACPKIAVNVMAGCGHNVHLENPAGYTTALNAFLAARHG